MKTRFVVVTCAVVAAASCKPDGPGFYGRTLLAGGSASSASQAAASPIARQVVRTALPPLLRGTFEKLVATTAFPRRFTRPVKKPFTPLVEKWRDSEVIVSTAVPQRANLAMLRRSLMDAVSDEALRTSLIRCNTAKQCLWRVTAADGKFLDAAGTRRAAAKLHNAKDVRWAEVNRISYALATPDDEYREFQWHYDQMNLPTAWDITTGNSDVTVAVLDTGLSTASGDFAGRVGQGADLISDTSISNDGDGRDNDPTDPGDEAAGGGSFHGTHVAGTIGAATNNGSGVAGVSWAGTILPVRVLGLGGGTGFDIMGGISWALGDSVEGVSQNGTPADVLNLSLGGPGSSAGYDEAIQQAVDNGALVFVAAGNDNVDASTFSPANVGVAITIGATNFAGTRASYSNFGSQIDIMAPGGELAEDRNGDGYADGVLSTVQDSFDFLQGTSMATPHMAGLGVLLKSVNRSIRQSDVDSLLKQTWRQDLTCDECGGAKLVDAAAALGSLSGSTNGPFLTVAPSLVKLAKDESGATLNLRNAGAEGLNWSSSFVGDAVGFSVSPSSGWLSPGASASITVSLSRSQRAGETMLVLSVDGVDQQRNVTLSFDEALSRKKADVQESIVVALVQNGEELEIATFDGYDEGDEDGTAAVLAEKKDDFAYKLQPLNPNDYLIVGLTDDDGSGQWEDGEGVGIYPDLADPKFVTLEEDQKLEGVDFIIRPTFLGGTNTCPDNSHADGSDCVCNDGFIVSDDGKSCVAG